MLSFLNTLIYIVAHAAQRYAVQEIRRGGNGDN